MISLGEQPLVFIHLSYHKENLLLFTNIHLLLSWLFILRFAKYDRQSIKINSATAAIVCAFSVNGYIYINTNINLAA